MTCNIAQQLGAFANSDASKCDKPMSGLEFKQSARLILTFAAFQCCKSKQVDQTVCKADKCVYGLLKCAEHRELNAEVQKASKELTNAKAMKKDRNGKLIGDCSVALKNRVEGQICCPVLAKVAACITNQAGTTEKCKSSWDKNFPPTLSNLYTIIVGAFETGGYCSSAPRWWKHDDTVVVVHGRNLRRESSPNQ